MTGQTPGPAACSAFIAHRRRRRARGDEKGERRHRAHDQQPRPITESRSEPSGRTADLTARPGSLAGPRSYGNETSRPMTVRRNSAFPISRLSGRQLGSS